MGVWGKIIGGTTGFALGGPIGALLGLMAGHGIDKAKIKKKPKTKEYQVKEESEQVFATGVIAPVLPTLGSIFKIVVVP